MIVGITGTDGAGKSTVVHYLMDQYGFARFSARDFLTKEAEVRNLPADRHHLRLIGNDLRRLHGNDMLVREALAYKDKNGVSRIVIDSIRNEAELDTLRQAGGYLIAVDASASIRYARIAERASSTDQITYEAFVAHEKLEANDPDPHGLQKGVVLQKADHTFQNNGTVADLHRYIDAWFAEVNKE